MLTSAHIQLFTAIISKDVVYVSPIKPLKITRSLSLSDGLYCNIPPEVIFKVI